MDRYCCDKIIFYNIGCHLTCGPITMQSINQKDILTGKIQAINGFKWPDGRLRWEQKDILTGGVLDIEIKN